MRILQTVFGVFHHFELARELDRRGHLERIYSTWPWARLKREGLDHRKVETFPWVHLPEVLALRSPVELPWLTGPLGYATSLTFDLWTDARLKAMLRRGLQPDALVGISGSSLKTGTRLQREGGVFLCDRGSTHMRFQAGINRDEFKRWGIDRDDGDPRDIAREEAIYDIADAITVPSTYAKRSFVECGVSTDKIHVIPYGVRMERFCKVADPEAGTFEVVYVGNVGMHKGVAYLLEAFAHLQHPRKRLRMIGSVSPAMRPILSRLPQENVEFLGHVPQVQLPELLSRSHVLVLPSIDDGFGMVMNQAMACGCPVIASTNTGGLDLVTEGQDGFIVPIRDPQAITICLQQLADDPDLQRRMSEASLVKVRSVGGWTEYGDQWERLLQQLSGSR